MHLADVDADTVAEAWADGGDRTNEGAGHPISPANQSVKRLIDPEDIAAMVLFLTGPHCRTITGQIIPIDGDSKSTQ